MNPVQKEELIDCPVCMDCIVGNTNKVVTECGHCFHTNCLMANIAHNGFGCPYCRTMMAEEPEEDVSVISYEDEDSINSSMRGLTEDEYCSYLALTSIRYLFREEGDEEEDEESDEESDEEQEYPKPSIEYLVQKLQEEGYTMERLVKACLIEHDEYDNIEDECMLEADKIFDSLRILISNFTQVQAPQNVEVNTTTTAEESKEPITNNFIRSSYV